MQPPCNQTATGAFRAAKINRFPQTLDFFPQTVRADTQLNANLPFTLKNWRRERDSNPRTLAGQRFSRPPQSTALPSLLVFDYFGGFNWFSLFLQANIFFLFLIFSFYVVFWHFYPICFSVFLSQMKFLLDFFDGFVTHFYR